MAKNKQEPKIEIMEGTYATPDQVVLSVEITVPQPDIVEKKEYSVARIKKEIAECDINIARYTSEKAQWEAILTTYDAAIRQASGT